MENKNGGGRNAVIYARYSPRPGSRHSDSCEKQITTAKEYCARKNYTIQKAFKDENVSGKSAERPGIWDAVNSLKFEWVLVARDSSRIARDVYLYETIKKSVEANGADIELVEGIQGDSHEDRLIRRIITAFNQYQADVIAARTSIAMKRKMYCDWQMISSNPPYGYKQDPNDPKHFIEDPEEQETIALIQGLAEQEGMKMRWIARKLDAMGREPRGGGEWNHSTVIKILERMEEWENWEGAKLH